MLLGMFQALGLIMGFAPINHHNADMTLNPASRLKNGDPGSAFEYAPNIYFVSTVSQSIGRAEDWRSFDEALSYPKTLLFQLLFQPLLPTSIPVLLCA